MPGSSNISQLLWKIIYYCARRLLSTLSGQAAVEIPWNGIMMYAAVTGLPRACYLAGLFLGKKAHDSLPVTLVKVGAGKEKDAQANESDDAVHLLKSKDIVNEDL
jgi:hypothetical protein